MEQKTTTMTINGVEYIRADAATAKTVPMRDGMRYVIVRSRDAGVHAGYLESLNDKHAVVLDARRLWYWEGAASLSQLAMEGVKAPTKCKFPCEVARVELTDAIEILDCTELAKASIASVAVWKM